jgi:hypothetical protein
MSKQIPKVLLFVALLAAFVVSGSAAVGRTTCRCYTVKVRILPAPGGCKFDKTTSQCVSVSCSGVCF